MGSQQVDGVHCSALPKPHLTAAFEPRHMHFAPLLEEPNPMSTLTCLIANFSIVIPVQLCSVLLVLAGHCTDDYFLTYYMVLQASTSHTVRCKPNHFSLDMINVTGSRVAPVVIPGYLAFESRLPYLALFPVICSSKYAD